MAIGSGKRVEFERDVFSRNTLAPARIAPRRRSRALPIIALIVLLAGAAAVGGAVAMRSGFFNSEKRAIERMSKTLVNKLKTANYYSEQLTVGLYGNSHTAKRI